MNPFLANVKLEVIQMTESTNYVSTASTKGVVKSITNSTTYFIERQKGTTIYDVPGFDEIYFSNLKASARELYVYICLNIQYNSDTINLSYANVSKVMKVSRPTLISAVQQLSNAGVICKTSKQSVYWINPLYIFRGSRLEYYNKECPSCIQVIKEINR